MSEQDSKREQHQAKLVAAGMPPGLAAIAAEVCYPGGPLGDDVADLMPCRPAEAQHGTAEWLKKGATYTPALKKLLAGDPVAFDTLMLRLARENTARSTALSSSASAVSPASPAPVQAPVTADLPTPDTTAEPSTPAVPSPAPPQPAFTPGPPIVAPAPTGESPAASTVTTPPAVAAPAAPLASPATHDAPAPGPEERSRFGRRKRDEPRSDSKRRRGRDDGRPDSRRDHLEHELAGTGMPPALALVIAEACHPGGPWAARVAALRPVPTATAQSYVKEWQKLGSASSSGLRRRLFADQDALSTLLGVLAGTLPESALPSLATSDVPLDAPVGVFVAPAPAPADGAVAPEPPAPFDDRLLTGELDDVVEGDVVDDSTGASPHAVIDASALLTGHLEPMNAASATSDLSPSFGLPGWESVTLADPVAEVAEVTEVESPLDWSLLPGGYGADSEDQPSAPAFDLTDEESVMPVDLAAGVAAMSAPVPATPPAFAPEPVVVHDSEQYARPTRVPGKLGAGWVPPERRPPRVQH